MEELFMTPLEATAAVIREVYEAFLNAGFDEEQAFAFALEYYAQALSMGSEK